MLALALSLALGPAARPGTRGDLRPAPRLRTSPSAGIYPRDGPDSCPGSQRQRWADIVFANDTEELLDRTAPRGRGAVGRRGAALGPSPFADRECYRVNGSSCRTGRPRCPGACPRARPLRRLRPCGSRRRVPAPTGLAPCRWTSPRAARSEGRVWTITVDLAGGAEIDGADAAPCAPGYDGVIEQDGFGWGHAARRPHRLAPGWRPRLDRRRHGRAMVRSARGTCTPCPARVATPA